MTLKHTYIIILISLLLPSIASGQRLASPELTVKEPTFADMSSASVSWNPVANATEYIPADPSEETNPTAAARVAPNFFAAKAPMMIGRK